ncbi:diaminopimelate epimerase [Priestia filamentosa]|uniref:diaminopimelate epimerase n=1 Tax=Priestia filamentosa TaxID=1402861 RepID=UPI002E1D1AC0|nr:diaminopimelate epimerase [Priestia filamentosa]
MEYIFKFKLTDVYPRTVDSLGTKEVAVSSTVKTEKDKLLFQGNIRVRFNEFGIFPDARDIAKAVEETTIRKQLTFELKRYVKPHRKFLV